MSHFKKRKRRRKGIKGCCSMCMLRKTDGRPNGRTLTRQELRAQDSYEVWARDYKKDLGR